jgi:hypothetical protein
MSLQLLAKQMEAKGRKGDSMLVHMTAGEVEGLQKLAESAGGSLSVNPETGLVEANFLKRMLPTLVGLGVGAATMNPYAGAAAGAAVGGYQARRNDQDVLLGAAMGGLGGYGGASMGAGLTAAGGATAAPLTASQGFSQAGQGISALGTDPVARGAFMSQVGGGAGLVSDVGMAAAPMMAPGKAPGPAPVDDEMYSYEYNPGRTGAERNPMATTAERRYFDSSYSPMRKIKPSQYGMAQGGLMSLAEGGSTGTSSEGMTGASKAALDYLMGRSEDSGFAGQGSGSRGVGGSFSGGDGMYSFDPATGQFTRNPNYVDPEELERQRKEAEAAAEAARQAAAESAAADERRRIEEEEARRRAIPNATAGTLRSPGDYVDTYDHTYDPQRDAQSGGSRAPSWVGLPADMIRDPSDNSFDPGRDAQSGGSRGESWQSLPADMRDDGSAGYQDYMQAGGYDPSSGQSYAESVGMGGDYGYSGYADGGDGGDGPDGWKAGGLMSLAKGGMKSGGFVVPADVVSMIGEGNTDAGYSRIKSIIPGATAIKGKDGGQADTVKTSIEGKQPARVAHGEMYIPPETVKRMGGAKKLYAMMDRVRQQATGSKKQIKPVSLKRAMA